MWCLVCCSPCCPPPTIFPTHTRAIGYPSPPPFSSHIPPRIPPAPHSSTSGKVIVTHFLSGTCLLSLTPAIPNILLLAQQLFVEWYLSLRYTTSLMPDCMITLAHSLQGKRAT